MKLQTLQYYADRHMTNGDVARELYGEHTYDHGLPQETWPALDRVPRGNGRFRCVMGYHDKLPGIGGILLPLDEEMAEHLLAMAGSLAEMGIEPDAKINTLLSWEVFGLDYIPLALRKEAP